MKSYQTLLASTTKERTNELKKSFNRAGVLTEAKNELQKQVAKLFVAMIAGGDCQPGEMRKHGVTITGEDIREKLQDVYGLVNVFQAVVDGTIAITEDEFDKMDQAKLALLSPFLSEKATPERKAALNDAVEAAKNGTANDIRKIAKATKGEDAKKDKDAEKPQATEIPVGFVATDITPGEALVKSRQFRARLMADFTKAIETKDEESLTAMLSLFGKAYVSACNALGDDPLDFIAELAARDAAPATGTVVETPAAAIGEAVAA